jgi:hypothetical protein
VGVVHQYGRRENVNVVSVQGGALFPQATGLNVAAVPQSDSWRHCAIVVSCDLSVAGSRLCCCAAGGSAVHIALPQSVEV